MTENGNLQDIILDVKIPTETLIEEKNGKSDIKKAYRVFAIKLREAGYNLNQATIEIRGVFNAFNSSYPTERTIREHIRDIIPAKN